MGWLKSLIFRLLKIKPANERQIIIQEPLSFHANVLKNQIWYRGEPAEIEQFFKQAAEHDADKARFWASVPQRKIRKIHSGIVGIVIDRFRDIVMADMESINFGEDGYVIQDIWDEISKDCEFYELIGAAVSGALALGDGAFKISIQADNKYPVLDFYESDRVEYIRNGRKIKEIKFYTKYEKDNHEYRLEEIYGIGYVDYKLYNEYGKEISLKELDETKEFSYTTFSGNFMMAEPLIIFPSTKWKGRGKALFDSKTDCLDALDEVISQWLDAVRKGRINRYIPDDMIPRNPENGQIIEPNDFDNDYIAIGTLKIEGSTNKIDISQPDINYEAYVSSYANFLDLVLQGIMSPSTLGIDLKKTDNAESQREKEKITLHTRNKIVDTLTMVIPNLIEKIMKVYDLMYQAQVKDYEVTVSFGEYVSPEFDSIVETVGKGKTQGIISIEAAVEELYGDSKDKKWKKEEVKRLKLEQGINIVDEPSVAGYDGLEGELNEETTGQ